MSKKPTNERTSKTVASIASKALQNPKAVTPKEIKTIAGSALTQAQNKPKR